jgi:SAM-dependent methyltransferase
VTPRLDRWPDRLRAPLRACAQGEVPANIALMRVLIEAVDRDEASRILEAVDGEIAREPASEAAPRLRRLLNLWRENPQAFDTVKAVLAHADHGAVAANPTEGIAQWTTRFDRMAGASPEAGVALYALGNPELLAAATLEVIDRLRTWGLLGANRTVLEIGCGIGRFVAALGPEVRHVTGIDISGAMIARARERCAGLPNVTLQVSSGRDLEPFAGQSMDLILAADVFPYLVQAGAALVERHVSEVSRVLKPGGALVVLNYSYRGDGKRDRADLDDLARRNGLALDLALTEAGERPFALWDACAFRLSKA